MNVVLLWDREHMTIRERFDAKVRVLPNGCHEWTAAKSTKGYGQIRIAGRTVQAHRWAFEQAHGPIPPGRHLDHFRYPEAGCIGPACVHPDHLRPVTPRENTLRGASLQAANAAKSTCPEGHPYDAENTLHSSGRRYCRACKKVHSRATARRRRERAA